MINYNPHPVDKPYTPMLSKKKFYLFTTMKLCLWSVCLLLIYDLVGKFYKKYNLEDSITGGIITFIVITVIMALFCLGDWIPTFSYKKYSQSEELQEETEFWKSWGKKKER
jgi:uncharacterized membrane protein YagU involved in acid resistance